MIRIFIISLVFLILLFFIFKKRDDNKNLFLFGLIIALILLYKIDNTRVQKNRHTIEILKSFNVGDKLKCNTSKSSIIVDNRTFLYDSINNTFIHKNKELKISPINCVIVDKIDRIN